MSNISYKGRLIDGTLGDGYIAPERTEKVMFNYVATTVYVGSLVCHTFNADPENAAYMGYYPGNSVTAPAGATLLDARKVAGVIIDLGETKGTSDGWITIAKVQPGDVVTLAVAEASDTGDYQVIAAAGVTTDGGTTLADGNVAICLYDEDSANNPHGASALGSGVGGLVECVIIAPSDGA